MSYTYPSALLPAKEFRGQSTVSQPSWKPDHLLTRPERRRLSDEARDINVYDLGWRENIAQALLGDAHARSRQSRAERIAALWPLAPARHGDGHDFEYDERKLDRLRRLTEKLRLGVTREADGEDDDSQDT
jgi:hypothetical protein